MRVSFNKTFLNNKTEKIAFIKKANNVNKAARMNTITTVTPFKMDAPSADIGLPSRI